MLYPVQAERQDLLTAAGSLRVRAAMLRSTAAGTGRRNAVDARTATADAEACERVAAELARVADLTEQARGTAPR